MCYNRLAYHGTRLQELHQGIAITMAWSSPINSSRVVLPVWDWTEIGRQGGAFTIKLKVRKRYARRQTPDEDSIATGLTDVLVVCLVVEYTCTQGQPRCSRCKRQSASTTVREVDSVGITR